ncbi:MAG: PaaI family thioesterase, partial [Bacteroidetes bacterium]|nr:PaaI family thioesterase [Bacteroidota bacterium]
GFVHGGATATFADLVMGFAAYSLVKSDQVVVTADLRVSYLNPGIGEHIFARGWVIKPGSKLIFCEGEIVAVDNGKETVIAKSSATMAVVNLSELKR